MAMELSKKRRAFRSRMMISELIRVVPSWWFQLYLKKRAGLPATIPRAVATLLCTGTLISAVTRYSGRGFTFSRSISIIRVSFGPADPAPRAPKPSSGGTNTCHFAPSCIIGSTSRQALAALALVS